MKPSRCILVIDDCEDDRELIHRLLTRRGRSHWQVHEADTGEEGLAMLKQLRPDCVLLDYSLPGQDGLKTLERIRRVSAYIPVVILTGQGDESIAATSIKKGAQDYIAKSFMTESAIHRAIEKSISELGLKKKVDEQREELEQFARLLAHDLKHPLNAIHQLLKHIQKSPEEFSPPVMSKFELISDASKNACKLIDTLSNYTRLDKQQPDRKTLCLTSMANQASQNLYKLIEAKQASIVIEELPQVAVIPELITQLFQILIENALTYSVAQPEVYIHAEIKGDCTCIHVIDNGIGIESKYQNKIFKPFFRLHSKDEYPGTGLGLATCKRIMERHQGKIRCGSNAKGNTVFTVMFYSEQ